MVNLFTRRRSSGGQPLIMNSRSQSQPQTYQGSSAINPNPSIFSDWGTNHSYEWAVDPNEQQLFDGGTTSKKGVSKLVKKLNCGANRRELRERTRYSHQQHAKQLQQQQQQAKRAQQQDQSWGWNLGGDIEAITRPVLITVKDGQAADRNSTAKSVEEQRSFVVGEKQKLKRSSSRFGFGSLRNSRLSRSFTGVSPNARTSPRKVSFKGTASNNNTSREMDDVVTSRERARKQRWRKGIEKSWKDDADLPSLVSGDESVHGYSAVSGSYTSGGSVDTDYTTEASSDESRGYSNPSRGRYGQVRTSPPRYEGGHGPRRRGKTDDLWSGVAEDMGILAGMLLSDGAACVGGVAAITHETVAESCHAQPR